MPKKYMLLIAYSTLHNNRHDAAYWHALVALGGNYDLYVSELDPEEPGAIYQSREALRDASPSSAAYAVLMNHLIWPWRPVAAYLQPGQQVQYAKRKEAERMSPPPYYQVPGGDSGRDLLDLLQGLPPPVWLDLLRPEYIPVACYLAVDILTRAWRAGHPAKHCTAQGCAEDYDKIAVSAARLAALLRTHPAKHTTAAKEKEQS